MLELIFIIFVGGYCFNLGHKTYNEEKQNKVFCKRNLPLKDVKEYNHFCGKLIMGFAFAALFTMALMIAFQGWMSIVSCVLLIVESIAVVKIYAKKEITFLRRN